MKNKIAAVILIFLMLLISQPCFGVGVFLDTGEKEVTPRVLSLPYGFYNENFGTAVAYVYGITGYPQKQAAVLGTAMVGSRGSFLGFMMGRDLQLPWNERLFIDPIVSVGYFNENDGYVDGNPRFPNEPAGRHDSHEDNFIAGSGWDNFFRLTLKYLLPIGHGKDQVISTYVIDRGALVSGSSGGTSLNPFKSGKSYLRLRTFYRAMEINGDFIDAKIRTNGLDLSFFWDNRDFPENPTKGNSFQMRISRDFGSFDSSETWTNLDSELDIYFPLGASDWFRKRVIALDLWTSYSPSWKKRSDGSIDNRPPAYSGSTLGGIWRLKGYPTQRFSDKAAIYYSIEVRMMPEWNPFKDWEWFQKYAGVQWLQFVPFGEVGRVASSWNIRELHDDMNWCLGLGVRAWAKGIVVRIDTAGSEEGVKVQMMVAHPFQF